MSTLLRKLLTTVSKIIWAVSPLFWNGPKLIIIFHCTKIEVCRACVGEDTVILIVGSFQNNGEISQESAWETVQIIVGTVVTGGPIS